jgi:hypothetical protein
VAIIDLPSLWNSQIVVFFDEEYFNNFFIRDSTEQNWRTIPDIRDFLQEWNLDIPLDLSIRGYYEKIHDEDYNYEGEIWAVGEL